MENESTESEHALDLQGGGERSHPRVPAEEGRTYTRPTLKVGSENPTGKLGGNACCGHC